MRHALPAGALLLAACGNSMEIRPGMWTTEVTLSAGDNQLWSSKTERCIDPAGGDPVIGMLSVTPLGPCQASQTDSSGNRLSIIAQCMGRPGAMIGGMSQTRVLVSGSQSATAIDGAIEAELEREPQSAKLTGKLAAQRTGDC